MTRPAFMEQIHDILDESHFDNNAIQWIVKECKAYFVEFNKPITFDVFKVKVNDVSNDVLSVTIIEALKEIFCHLESNDLEFVESKSLDFFKNQTLKNAIIESVDILEQNGDFENIKKVIDTALNAGTERNIGHEYFEMLDERYEDMARDTIPTTWEVIDGLMQGGLAAGELGVVVAPAGVGKTWVLAALGAAAVQQDKTVIHYSLELNEAYVGLRYDSVLTGIANQNLTFHKDEVENKIKTVPGELIIKYFPTKAASVHTLASHIQRTKMLQRDVDMVIVDYADVLRDAGNAKEVRHQLGNIYEDLRGLAGELQVPIWTASQANRSSLDEDVIEAQKISESYIKIMTADFVMSLSRKMEDKIGNTGRFHIIKNRFGPDGLTYPSKVNTNTGHIEIFESASVGGKEQQAKIDNRDNIRKKILSNKYEELMQ